MADQGGLLAQQRRALILESVRRDGAVRVTQLVGQLGVSDMTIRRDLDALSSGGFLEKVHGGAVSVSTSLYEPGFEAKSTREATAKAAIADAAAARVEPGSVVAIGAGTTAHAVATRLVDVPSLTVVTNSLPVAEVFQAAAREGGGTTAATLLLTGGSPTPSAALVGPLADLVIGSLHVDLLILGTHGASEAAGLTSPNLAEARTNRALVAAARRVVVVADHTKWGVVGLSGFCPLADINWFITDDRLPAQASAVLAETVGELTIAGAQGN
ncbi:DeoR/GlpR family DNA-binding transcription regulator [Streptomyces sp. NPDC051320]|uniref:DeoR/GlpR family DNA-binding transcription regulator n=1 Tax=Streptomyces sp. NPDC051320 TaxID=3154644 RepID=UPI003431EF36